MTDALVDPRRTVAIWLLGTLHGGVLLQNAAEDRPLRRDRRRYAGTGTAASCGRHTNPSPTVSLPEPFGSPCVALCRKQACCMDAYLRLLGLFPRGELNCGRPHGLRLRGCFRHSSQLHQLQTWLQSFHPSIHSSSQPSSLRAWPTMIRGRRRGRATRARLPQNRQQPTSLAINRHRASHHHAAEPSTLGPGGWSIGPRPSVLSYLLH